MRFSVGVWVRRLAIAGAVLALVVLLLLEVLRYTAARNGVESVALPAGSEIAARAVGADYTDAYRAPLGDHPVTLEQMIAGAAFGGGREVARTANEVVYEGTAPGLRFLASLHLDASPGEQHLTLGTAVFYRSALGPVYFTPVKVGHRRLVPYAVHQRASKLRTDSEE